MFICFTKIAQPPRRKVVAFCVIFLACSVCAANAAPWTETFEGSDVKWRDGGGNARYQIEQMTMADSGQHGGKRCAYLKINGQGGSHVYTTLDVGKPLVIPELYPTVWVKSDRSGLRFFARVVLPKTIDPKTGQPLMLLLTGTNYTQVDQWQMLEVADLEKLFKQQVQVVRTQTVQSGLRVDGTGAYVDQLVLNVYGGSGVTNVLVDDAAIYGYVEMQVPGMNGMNGMNGTPSGPSLVDRSGDWSAAPSPVNPGEFRPGTTQPGAVQPGVVQPGAVQPGGMSSPFGQMVTPTDRFAENRGNLAYGVVTSSSQAPRVELRVSRLFVDDQPILVRAIRYRGESLATLKKLGFNAVWLSEEATSKLLSEALANGMYVICAPPKAIQVDVSPSSTELAPKIGPEYNQVLAWNLGHDLLETHIEPVRQLARQIRAADERLARPLICSPSTNLRAFSCCTDLLLVGRSPLGTSLEFSDYGTWIRERPRLARPGTPVWSTIQTEVSQELYEQWLVSGQAVSPPPMLNAEQIRLTAYTAIAAGSRGLLFESRESLEKGDPATLARATSLALLNMELELIRPWVATGTLIDTVRGSQDDTAGAIFSYNRSRLLVPIWIGRGAQFVPGQSAGNIISFTVPVPESNRAYEVTPGTLRPVKDRARVTGGVKVTLNEFSLSTLILFTEDAKTIATMRQRAQAIGEEAARLHRRLAENKLLMVQEVNRRMLGQPKDIWDVGDHLTESRKRLQECDAAIAAREWDKACVAADRAMRPLRIVERTNWSRAVGSIRSPMASPATICFSTLPWHWSLAQQAQTWQRSGNLLLGGDFEQLEQVFRAGWKNFTCPNSGIKTQVDITSEAAHTGACGIRIRALPEDPETKPSLVETPPAWIQSPTIQVAAGSIVRIEGWVHIPTPIIGSVDGLVVFDSMTGEPMAERIGETTGWQPFVLYRVATRTGPMTITMALAGIGEVWIDDVSIQTLTPVATQQPVGTPRPY